MSSGQVSLMPSLRRMVFAGLKNLTDGQLLGAFVTDRDTDAFAQLARRHGPMVMGVCRRVIGERTTAEDAFQAVFLVLARRAATVKPREQVGNWLFGVAYRTALKARAVLARRRGREKQVIAMPEPLVSAATAEWSDLQPVIDEELARLPEKLRLPIVLCDLEGRSQREVAKHLGVPVATLATRLASARRMLAQRLTKRGVTLSGGAIATLLTTNGMASAVPYALTHGLTRAVEAVAAGTALTGMVSTSTVQLSEGVIRMMLLTKLKAVAVATVTALTLSTGFGLGLVPARAASDGTAPTAVKSPVNSSESFITHVSQDRPAVSDDLAFLRRLTTELRGTLPTDIETFFFVDDPDAGKRDKVVEWFLTDDDAKAYAAKKLGVPVERIRLVRVEAGKDGKPVVTAVVIEEEKGDKELNAERAAASQLYARILQSFPALSDEKKRTGQDEEWERVVEEARRAVKAYEESKRKLDLAVQRLADGKDDKNPKLRTEKELREEQAQLKKEIEELRKLVESQKEKLKQQSPGANKGEKPRAQSVEQKRQAEEKLRLRDEAEYRRQWAEEVQRQQAAEKLKEAQRQLEKLRQGTGQGVKKPSEGQPLPGKFVDGTSNTVILSEKVSVEGDLDFLKRVTMAARGTPPTALEQRYFTEDKDPKKREKLIDTLLKDPAVAKKLGDDFKKKILGGGQGQLMFQIIPNERKPEAKPAPPKPKDGGVPLQFEFKIVPDGKPMPEKKDEPKPKPEPNPKSDAKPGKKQFDLWLVPAGPMGPFQFEFPALPANPAKPNPPKPPQPEGGRLEIPVQPANPPKPPQTPATPKPPAPQADKLGKLIGELLAAKKTDAEMLEAVTLATLSRLPTDLEKKLTLGLVAKSADRKTAWTDIAKMLAASESSHK